MTPSEVDALTAAHARASIEELKKVPGPHTAAAVRAMESKVADRCEAVLCSQPAAAGYLFAAVKLKSGRYAAVYAAHTDDFESLEALKAELNQHERTLLEYGVLR